MNGFGRFAGRGRVLLGAVVLALAAACAAPHEAAARPLIPAEHRYDSYAGVLPVCGDPGVVERVRSLFHDRETEFWKSGLEIVGLERVREIGFRSEGLDYIPRRYCRAEVYLNNRTIRPVSYSIDEDLGFAGFGYDVEWCVGGLDRDHASGANCRSAQP